MFLLEGSDFITCHKVSQLFSLKGSLTLFFFRKYLPDNQVYGFKIVLSVYQKKKLRYDKSWQYSS